MLEMQRLGPLAVASLRILAVAAAYFAAAKVGLLEELVRGQVTPLWPPTGIAVVCLLVFGLKTWPGITLGAFLVNVSIGPTVLAAAGIAVGNTLAPVCAYLLLQRVDFRVQLDRLRDALALIFLGALGGMLVSATVGSGVLLLADAIPAREFWSTWSVWWVGDAMGVLVFAPVLLVLRKVRRPRWPTRAQGLRWAEAAALVVGTTGVALVATRTSLELLFLVFPFLIWAALRFQLAGAAPCALIVATLAIYATAHGTGPFAGKNLFSSMVTLQAFNGSAALTALLLAVITTQRDHAHREIQRACNQLANAVATLERSVPLTTNRRQVVSQTPDL